MTSDSPFVYKQILTPPSTDTNVLSVTFNESIALMGV